MMRMIARGCVIFYALLLSVLLSGQTVSFVVQNQITTANGPDSLALANLTNRGTLDLLIANQGSASLSTLRGLGGGFFQPITNQPTGNGPRAMVVDDFNRDGRLDVAVANLGSNSVSVLLGNGDGTFHSFSSIAAPEPTAVLAADFNGDGKLDLAVAASGSNAVVIFLGNGNGTFYPFFSAPTGNRPVSIAVADFNGDGKPDLAVANANSNDVSILLGNGNGSFQVARRFPAGPSPAYLALADFDGDGITDLAVANDGSAGSVSLLLGLGNGTFLVPRTFATGPKPSFLVPGDFNLDGKADLAVANTGANTVSILLGTGNGVFLSPLDFVSGTAPAWITVADLNGDRRPDLLIANSGSNTVTVLLNSTATIAPPRITSVISAAAFQTGPVAPGELVTILGSNLGPEPGVGAQLSSTAFVDTQLGQTQVFFDGVAAPLLYAASGQLSAVVPYGVAGRARTQLMIGNGGQFSASTTVPVAASAPALFTADASGQGQGAILNQDGSLNSPGNPAARGSIVVLYATGAGATNPFGVDGQIATGVLAAPMLPVAVAIDGVAAPVLYAGAAPGLVSGITQINVRVPDSSRSGAVSVLLQVGSATSQPGVTFSVQ